MIWGGGKKRIESWLPLNLKQPLPISFSTPARALAGLAFPRMCGADQDGQDNGVSLRILEASRHRQLRSGSAGARLRISSFVPIRGLRQLRSNSRTYRCWGKLGPLVQYRSNISRPRAVAAAFYASMAEARVTTIDRKLGWAENFFIWSALIVLLFEVRPVCELHLSAGSLWNGSITATSIGVKWRLLRERIVKLCRLAVAAIAISAKPGE